MDWRSINFDWNRARAFYVTAEEGSLVAAAKALNLTQSTLSRQVSALEKELGVSLFEKVGRGLEITPSGLELIEHVRVMADAANRFSLAATGKSASLEGVVRISATEAMASFVLPALLKELRAKEPGIEIELIASNASSDLRRREADIAVRNFQPTHGELIAKQLPTSNAYLYASTAYLDDLGVPADMTQLASADYIGFVDNSAYVEGLQELGLNITARNFPYMTENHLAHWELVKQGAGIGVMLGIVGDKVPGVERVSDQITPFPVDTWLVVHRELKTNRRIRVVYDFLYEALGKLLS